MADSSTITLTVSEAVKRRQSVRAFRDTPVDADLIRSILKNAQRAPSSCNMQPWHVIALAGQARQDVVDLALANMDRRELMKNNEYPFFPDVLKEPYLTRRIEAGEALYNKVGIARDDKTGRHHHYARNFKFFDAPVGLLFFIDRSMVHLQWAHLGMYMQTVALLAQERGLSTCMQEFWGMMRPVLEPHLGTPKDLALYAGMAVGYADDENPAADVKTDRANFEDFAELRGF